MSKKDNILKEDLKKCVDKIISSLDGRLLYLKQIDSYVIMVPVGYDGGKETVYKDKTFPNIHELKKELNIE